MKLLPVVISFALCCSLLSVAEPVPLADASASASVQAITSPEGFAISVIFRPVTTLDEVTNKEMTEVIAQFYAEESISTFLHSQKGIDFAKVKATNKSIGEGRVQWAFTVPAGVVMDAEVEVAEVRKQVINKKPSAARPDAKTKLLDFRSSCFRDLRIAESLFAVEAEKCKDGQAREKLRRRIENAFAALREKIKADDGLFRAEKKELFEKAEKIESFLLREASADGDVERADNQSLPIIDAVFIAPFDKILKGDPILLRSGGARFVELGDGNVAIVAVGSAMADNDGREDIAEMMASAALAKLKAGEETVTESRIERSYIRSVGIAGAAEAMEMKRTSKTTINSADFHKNGDKVGTWLSKDGKRFFLAFGRIVRQGDGDE